MNQYQQTRSRLIDFCFICKTTTPHIRVHGDYLPAARAYQCSVCEIEIVIYLEPITSRKAESEPK